MLNEIVGNCIRPAVPTSAEQLEVLSVVALPRSLQIITQLPEAIIMVVNFKYFIF